MTQQNPSTNMPSTWCPGCFNFQILGGVMNFLSQKNLKDWAIVTGIGCHGKMFDYVNLPGINALHGRVLPTCLGMKIANPKLNVLGFSGDGDAYAEGMEHLIHLARYNSDINYIVHNNQVFALTVGQPTPVTERGFKDKTMPFGVKLKPINPIKLMLASGATFVARVFADVKEIENVLKEAEKHKGFSFIEVIQPCIIFHPDIDLKKHVYNLTDKNHDKTNLEQAMKKTEEFDYDVITEKTKIPVGIFYKTKREVFEDLVRER
jgi:2-oxoglutarate/2-oxoacid ferredoxin oxidoreductase subunit beta